MPKIPTSPARDPKRSRSWCFTWNNHGLEDPAVWLEALVTSGKCSYVVCQEERGEDTGTIHLQGSIYFQQPKTLTALIKLQTGPHYEPMRGSWPESKAYCIKADTRVRGPWEYGVEPQQGRRTDLVDATSEIAAGRICTMHQLAETHPTLVVKYHRGFEALLTLRASVRKHQTRCFYLYGETGTGKTHGFDNLGVPVYQPIHEVISKTYAFNGYRGQSVVIFDEVTPSSIPRNMWLCLANSNEYHVPTKGGGPVSFTAHLCVVVSNHPPTDGLLADPAWCRRWRVVHVQTREQAAAFWSERSDDLHSAGVSITSGTSVHVSAQTSRAEGEAAGAPPALADDPPLEPPKLVRQVAQVFDSEDEY